LASGVEEYPECPRGFDPSKEMKNFNCVILSEEVAAATDESKDPFVAQSG
jgi:hypothetical protein